MVDGVKVDSAPKCPGCGKTLDGVAAVDTTVDGKKEAPTPGCVTICVYCTSFLWYDKSMQLNEFTTEQFNYLPASVRLQMYGLRDLINRRLSTIKSIN